MGDNVLREFLVRANWTLSSQFGIDLRKMLRSFRGSPRFIRDFFVFRSRYAGRLVLRPCLHDWYEEGGTTNSEYFWQDLVVAKKVFERNPRRHVDIGSRVDGFIAHVASFREIEVFDVRPVSAQVPGVTFRQADIMNPVSEMAGCCDSLSCLHALEHFGLGRYRDPIDPEGFRAGLRAMSSFLEEGGTLYLSVPIGVERVEFNAHRVFDPSTILDLATKSSLRIDSLCVISDRSRCSEVVPTAGELAELATKQYSLGVFTFTKTASGRLDDQQ